MTALILHGKTLGEKHKNYNKILKEVCEDGQTDEIAEISEDRHDVENLLIIDAACHQKDVEYVLKVIESKDILYVSRAIQKSTWLITEMQYAHIINPEYLKSHLFPRMSTKAYNKLIKHIRHYLKDEKRVEEFYRSEKSTEIAVKWLPHCSVTFIENNINNHISHLKPKLFKRLCEKSFTIFEKVMENRCSHKLIDASTFLLTTNTEKYLDVLNNLPSCNTYIKLGAKATEFIMKKYPYYRINNKLIFDIPTFAKHIKKEEIKDFLYEQANEYCSGYLNCYNEIFHSYNLLYLIRNIPENERFPFVKDVFIDELKVTKNVQDRKSDIKKMQKLNEVVTIKKYIWYQFAPFEIALSEIKKLIQCESFHHEKYEMLSTLYICAGKNLKHIQTLLQYYYANHINDPIEHQYQFVADVLNCFDVNKCDQMTWQLLNEIFKNMDLYGESTIDEEIIIHFIIVYNTLQNIKVPEIIENKFIFDTLKTYTNRLDEGEKHKVFIFLYNHLLNKIQKQNLTKETLIETKNVLKDMLLLLKDWKQDILNYPTVLNKIKEIIKINNENSWKANLTCLYNINKSWRKHMFEESILLSPTEEVFLNALKHDPELLTRYRSAVEATCHNNCQLPRKWLNKLRIYWPHTLAAAWADAYLEHLNTLESHKALIRGLCILLPQKQLLNIITKYCPKEPKINWSETDELHLSLQKHIAKSMHLARPQPTPDVVLSYAKGDYLQYALPSVLAIFYDLNTILSREYIPQLINAPVSLRKHGLRIAFVKLETKELNSVFLNIWKTSTNISIRVVIFKYTFELLCNEVEEKRIESFWETLELFIDSLMFEEDKNIYELLSQVEKVPLSVRANYLIKSYRFLQHLLPHVTIERPFYERYIDKLVQYTREIMEYICPDFIKDVILDFINTKFFNVDNDNTNSFYYMLGVISAYLLSTQDIESQSQRYEETILPLIKRSLSMWDKTNDGKYFVRKNLQKLLHKFRLDLKDYVIKKNMIVPFKIYSDILMELQSLVVSENYLMLTMWKITTLLTNLVQKHKASDEWDNICFDIYPELEELCIAYLKEDVESYFPGIYVIFGKALRNAICDFMPVQAQTEMCEQIILHEDCVEACLVAVHLIPYNQCRRKQDPVLLQKAHLSAEVKMHYYDRFKI